MEEEVIEINLVTKKFSLVTIGLTARGFRADIETLGSMGFSSDYLKSI